MNRRHLVVGGLAAGAAGVGGKLWADARLDAETGGLWTMRFDKPGGGELRMAAFRGKPLLLNFWATWCPPCLKELPLLDRFARHYAGRGWQVVGLAIDSPTPVREFLRRTPLGFPTGLAGFDGTELTMKLGNGAGALPFTAVFDARGRIAQRKLGETSWDELVRWAGG